ncbi:MAG: FkbM family methyltransferase [Halieaceae bacterium]
MKTSVVYIGQYVLPLDLRHKHDRVYSTNPTTIDTLLADAFMCRGDRVLDAGANIGFTALHYICRGASEVHAIEPAPEVFFRLNSLEADNLFTHNIAFSDFNGSTEIFLSRSHNQGHTLNPGFLKLFPSVFGEDTERATVEVATLDRYFPSEHFDYWKVDIEGSESKFLAGAEAHLKFRPPRVVQIELYPAEYDAAAGILSRFYSTGLRAVHNPNNDQLLLLDPCSPELSAYANQAPVYIFY